MRQLMSIDMLLSRSTINEGTHRSHRVVLTLRLERDVYVGVSLFDGLAFAFHTQIESYGSAPKVILVTSINPRAAYFLTGTSILTLRQLSETNSMKSKNL
ncbi:unnamed protein product [Brassica oleracea]